MTISSYHAAPSVLSMDTVLEGVRVLCAALTAEEKAIRRNSAGVPHPVESANKRTSQWTQNIL